MPQNTISNSNSYPVSWNSYPVPWTGQLAIRRDYQSLSRNPHPAYKNNHPRHPLTKSEQEPATWSNRQGAGSQEHVPIIRSRLSVSTDSHVTVSKNKQHKNNIQPHATCNRKPTEDRTHVERNNLPVSRIAPFTSNNALQLPPWKNRGPVSWNNGPGNVWIPTVNYDRAQQRDKCVTIIKSFIDRVRTIGPAVMPVLSPSTNNAWQQNFPLVIPECRPVRSILKKSLQQAEDTAATSPIKGYRRVSFTLGRRL